MEADRAATQSAPIGIAIALGHLLNDFMANMLAPLLPILAVRYGLTNAALGAIMAVFSASSAFTQPFFGMAVDNYRRGSLLIWSVLWIGLAMSLVGTVDSLSLLVLLAFMGGLGSGLYHPLGSTLVPKVVAPAKQGFWMSIFFVVGNIGFALAPLVVVPLVEFGGLGSTAWLVIPTLLVAALMYRTGLGRVEDHNSTPQKPLASLAVLKNHLGQVWLPVLAVNLIVFLRTWVINSLNTFLPTFMVELGYSVITAGQMVSVLLLFGAFAMFPAGMLLDKIGARKVIASSLLLGALFLLLFYQTTGLTKWLALALAGAAINSSLPVTVVVVQRLLPANAGLASGLMIGLVSAIVSFFLPVIGAIADRWGASVALYSLLPLLPMASLLVGFLPAHRFRPH